MFQTFTETSDPAKHPPRLAALRKAMPDAWIGVLVNQYNVAVMRGNPDVNEVFAYRKAKHRGPGESKLAIWLETAGLLWKLRRKGVDVAIVASPGGDRYARLVGARRIIADKPGAPFHEVEAVVPILGGVHIILHLFRVLQNGGFTHTLRHKSPDNVDANNVLVGRDFLLRLAQFAAIQRILDATANVAGKHCTLSVFGVLLVNLCPYPAVVRIQRNRLFHDRVLRQCKAHSKALGGRAMG